MFAGDFWQLPAVCASSIFSNPFSTGYENHEQKILKMFWKPHDKDSIQKTFLLTESMRSEDKWLIALLDADRYGQESWEMYCFVHGIPTRNPGSWLPGEKQLACQNAHCQTLADDVWPALWRRSVQGTGMTRRENWLRRVEEECEICKNERKRRHCILGQSGENSQRHLVAPFGVAPYIHPFRHPSYHAT